MLVGSALSDLCPSTPIEELALHSRFPMRLTNHARWVSLWVSLWVRVRKTRDQNSCFVSLQSGVGWSICCRFVAKFGHNGLDGHCN